MAAERGDAQPLRAALDSLADPLVLLQSVRDANGQIVDFTFLDANAAACAQNRIAHDDLIGLSVLDLFPAHATSGLLQRYAEVVETGVPAVLDRRQYEHEFFPGQQRFFDIRAAKVGDGITLTWRDVSDREAALSDLRESQERFRLLAETASDVVYFTDARRVVTWVSPAVTDLLGWRPEEVVGTVMADLLHPDDRDATTELRTQAYSGRPLDIDPRQSLDMRMRRKAGGYRWVRALVTTQRDGQGRVVGVVGALRDIDDLVRARIEFEEQRERTVRTMDGLMDPVIFFEAVRDDDGVVVDFLFSEANKAACAFNRITREDLLGSRLSERYPNLWTVGLFAGFAAVADGGDPLAYDDWAYGSDDEGNPRILDVRGTGAEGGLTVTFRDVTARSLAARALAASESRYRVLAENASDVVFEVDDEGRIGWVSPAVTAVLGWAPEELVDTSVCELQDSPDRDTPFAHCLEEGDRVVALRTRSGARIWGSFRVAPTTGPDGVRTGAIVGLTDVTDVVAARESAARARAAEERSRLSMDEAAIGLLVADLDFVITYANPELHRLVGVDDGGIVGLSILDGASPDELASLRGALTRVATGESEHELVRRSLTGLVGHPLWADTFVSPVRGADGRLEGLLGQIVDVTTEVANRDALSRNAEHFRLLAENASDVVYEVDAHGFIRWISPSVRQALGWDPDALVGTLSLDLVHMDDRASVERASHDAGGGPDTSRLVARFLSVGGGVRFLSASVRVLRSEDGAVSGAVIGLHDVTDETRMRGRLERSERTFRTAMLGAPQGVAISNLQDLLTDVNPALLQLLARDKTAILGCTLAEFMKPADPPKPTCAQELLAGGGSRVAAHEHQLAGQVPRWVEHSLSLIRDEDQTPLFFVHHLVEVTERHLREEDLGFRASHDLLTGLLNRAGLESRLADWLPVRGTGAIAVLYCDLDGLKAINDEHGHAAGDAVLAHVAARIEDEVRRGDIVARIGGDEFVVVLDRIQTTEAAEEVARKICGGVRGPVVVDGASLPAAVSVGLALAGPSDTAETLLARADAALYRAKLDGRARVSR